MLEEARAASFVSVVEGVVKKFIAAPPSTVFQGDHATTRSATH